MIFKVLNSFLDLAYPPLCLHCRRLKESSHVIFCPTCTQSLELIDPLMRCPFCFSAHYIAEKRLCNACIQRPPLLDKLAATFDYVGPAATLVRRLKYADQPFLAQGAGAWMAAQFLRLNWPFPDLIVPMPISFMHKLERGYNQSLLLAQVIAQMIDKPIAEILYRRSGDYSQAGLSRQQRYEWEGQSVQLLYPEKIRDKTILLIDDVMTTGTTLRKCTEVLLEGCPASIYGLVFCRALGN